VPNHQEETKLIDIQPGVLVVKNENRIVLNNLTGWLRVQYMYFKCYKENKCHSNHFVVRFHGLCFISQGTMQGRSAPRNPSREALLLGKLSKGYFRL